MLFLENIFLAINGLRANRMRSLLTMLGIIIGIASVVAIMSVGEALTRSTVDSLSSFGASEITLSIRPRTENDGEQEEYSFDRSVDSDMKDEDKLTREEIQDIMDQFPGRITAAKLENSSGDASMIRKGKEIKLKIEGENNQSLEGKKLKLLAGRYFTDKDQNEGRKVAVISDKAVREALKTELENAIGQEITVIKDGEFHHFTIVGVYFYDEKDLDNAFDTSGATKLFIPVSTSFIESHKKEVYSSVALEFENGVNSEELMTEVDDYVNRRYYRNNRNFMAKSFSNASFIAELNQSMEAVSIGISVIAAISLLVGGIGVMNIMLVSIQERTREIGTRKALGATNSSIRMQFIIEAIVLCIVGGIIGILLGLSMGYAGTIAMSRFASGEVNGAENMAYSIPYRAVFVSLIFSAGVGVFFGYYPANKAAKMNPIDALRYE